MNDLQKRCCECGEIKLKSDFYRNKSRPDGLEVTCKDCRGTRGNTLREARKDAGVCHCGRKLPKKFKTCSVCRKRVRTWLRANPEIWKQSRQDHKARLRAEVFAAYGNKCACCDETEPLFFNIDHINGGGNKHRRELMKAFGLQRGGIGFYRWLKSQGFPAGYRILCWNCNMTRGLFGFCPHERKRQEVATGLSWEIVPPPGEDQMGPDVLPHVHTTETIN